MFSLSYLGELMTNQIEQLATDAKELAEEQNLSSRSSN
jgi:hypothetical protein